MAVQLADFLEAEMSKDPEKPSKMVEVFAPKKRKQVWKDLSIYPAGVSFMKSKMP